MSDLLSNQFASFRKVCSISKNDLVNVFLLENPLSKDDLKQDEQWLSEFKDVYKEGQGKDTGFRLFRVLFTYDVDNATDVCSQMDATQLKGIIETHHNVIKNINDGERMFDQFLFYIDNQNSDAAALCLTQKEHNLILPRYLADIMMLISNTQDSYGVINAITNTSVCSTRCFSVGYAESMYYYPDVERYIISADQKNLLHECLYTEDNEVNNVDKKVMDVSKYPFGLLKRKKRLGEFYRDVPFSENIENYPQSADKIIDDNIIILKNLIEAKRKEEFNDFEHSEVVEKIRKEIESYKQQMDALISDNTIDDEEHKKKQEVAESKLKQAKILLKDMYNKFQPKCPEYLNRMSIYRSLFLINEEQKESIGKTKSENYKRLLDYVCSEDFLKFVEREETNSSEVRG